MKPKTKIDAFFTRARANEGIEMPLLLPDGTDSGETMHILGVDSDAFRKASAVKSREMTRILTLPEDERHDAHDKANAVLLASLVTGWSLDTPFTHENVVTLLLESRTVADQVDSLAGDRARFFAKR